MEGGGPSAPAPPRAPGPRCMCGLCPGSGSSGRWGAVQLRVREPVRAPGAPSAGPACLGQHLTWRVGRAARVGVLLPAGGAAGPHPCPTWPSRPSSPGQCDPDTGLGPGQAARGPRRGLHPIPASACPLTRAAALPCSLGPFTADPAPPGPLSIPLAPSCFEPFQPLTLTRLLPQEMDAGRAAAGPLTEARQRERASSRGRTWRCSR